MSSGGAGVRPLTITSLEQLAALIRGRHDVHLRYTTDPAQDRRRQSVDAESGLALPGLSVNPLSPEPWWTRPLEEWLARQICQYRHLQDREPDRRPWVVAGPTIARGPDCEPLLDRLEVLGWLDDGVVEEAERLYQARFAPGRRSPRT